MIYFDNSATSRPKPNVVIEAFNYYVNEIGVSPGRGSYGLAVQASRMLYQARKTVAAFFGIKEPSNVIFTKNSTEAINLFFNGFLNQNDHILISPYEHNAVLRPIHNLKEKGIIDYTVLSEEVIYNNCEELEQHIKPNTKAIVLTLASNLTGQYVFNKKIAKIAHDNNIFVFVDASQGAGKKCINFENDDIDVIAFTGHKDLFALPGVGGLVSKNELLIRPLIQGGTGIHGEEYINPKAYPDSYEAGTLNMPAIWSLKNSMDYINNNIDMIIKKENDLMSYLIDNLKRVNNIIIYNVDKTRVSTICFNIKGVPSSEIVRLLSNNDICVRGGIHCAILAHETLGTVETGAVRISLNWNNTKEEIDKLIEILEAL